MLPEEPTISYKTIRAFIPAIVAGAAYGLITRLFFDSSNGNDIWLTMTCSFLLVAPFALGYLTVWLSPAHQRLGGRYAFWAPWLASLLLFIGVLLMHLEIAICLVMAAPIFCLLASAGGLAARSVARRRNGQRQAQPTMTALVLLLPYLVAPVEQSLPVATSIRQVDTEIVINAPVTTIWQNIKSVPLIQPQEQHFNWLHAVGMPRPLAAELSHDGIGGVREASFENGLMFVERVTNWQPNRQIAFTIRSTGVETLSPWNMIGSAYFDVLDGAYTIEPMSDGRVRLLLTSRHRLSTRFNVYGGLWTDYIMRDLQNYILRVIKARCEQAR